MSETFKPIETQEELDTIIERRLSRERDKFADYDDIKKKLQSEKEKNTALVSQHEKDKADLQKQLNESNAKIKDFEVRALRLKVATDSGLPLDLRDYLQGETEEELKASAEALGKYANKPQVSPLANLEPGISKKTEKEKALKKMFADLKGE